MAQVMVGLVARRAADGTFLPAAPIYREAAVNERGRTRQEEENLSELSKLLAAKFKEYMDGCRAKGVEPS